MLHTHALLAPGTPGVLEQVQHPAGGYTPTPLRYFGQQLLRQAVALEPDDAVGAQELRDLGEAAYDVPDLPRAARVVAGLEWVDRDDYWVAVGIVRGIAQADVAGNGRYAQEGGEYDRGARAGETVEAGLGDLIATAQVSELSDAFFTARNADTARRVHFRARGMEIMTSDACLDQHYDAAVSEAAARTALRIENQAGLSLLNPRIRALMQRRVQEHQVFEVALRNRAAEEMVEAPGRDGAWPAVTAPTSGGRGR